MEVLERFYKQIAPWLDVRANDTFLLEAAGDPPTLENLVEAAKRLSGLSIRQDSAQFPATATIAGRNLAMGAVLPAALADERQALIDEITQGRSTFTVTIRNGYRKVYDSSTGEEVQYSAQGGQRRPAGNAWATLSHEQIKELHARVMEERRLKSLSASEIRKELKPHRQQYEAPSTKPVESSSGYVLVNPETNQEFTKIELAKFLNGGKGNATRILVHPSSKQIIPEAVARMKEIMGVSR